MQQLLAKMEALNTLMLDVAEDMRYYGGFNESISDHAIQLVGAAGILKTWIEGIGESNDQHSDTDK